MGNKQKSINASIKVGDLVKVITSNDSLAPVGGYGLVEKIGSIYDPDEKGKVTITFNFYTPFVHFLKNGEIDYVSVSGGPAYAIDVAKIRITGAKKTAFRNIYDGKDHTTEFVDGIPYKAHNLTGYQFDVPVDVPVHELFLVGPPRDGVEHIALEPPITVDEATTGLKILNQEIHDDNNWMHYKGHIDGNHREVSFAGTAEAFANFAKSKNLKPILITDNARVTRAFIEHGKNGPTLYYLNCNYPREEFPWGYKEQSKK